MLPPPHVNDANHSCTLYRWRTLTSGRYPNGRVKTPLWRHFLNANKLERARGRRQCAGAGCSGRRVLCLQLLHSCIKCGIKDTRQMWDWLWVSHLICFSPMFWVQWSSRISNPALITDHETRMMLFALPLLPFALLGDCWDPPIRFLAHLIIHLFRTCCENVRPRSRKVRSPGHVKWPHLIKSLNVRQRYTD